MDWMLPKVPPTGKHVRVPFIVVVKFEGDKVRPWWLACTLLGALCVAQPAAHACS